MPSVQKKINELEVGLLHLQQNIDIPEISLPIHPTIQGVVKKATDSGRKPSAEALSGSLGDSTFLNALQKDVSRWIREIQKVSRHRYMFSGTPLLRTPLGQPEVSLLQEVSSFQGSFCTYLYVGGTKHSVLFKVDVLISGVSL